MRDLLRVSTRQNRVVVCVELLVSNVVPALRRFVRHKHMLEIKKILYKLSCTAEPSHLYGKISCWERSKLSKRESQHFLLENAIWSPAPSPRLHDRFSCGELFETFSETF